MSQGISLFFGLRVLIVSKSYVFVRVGNINTRLCLQQFGSFYWSTTCIFGKQNDVFFSATSLGEVTSSLTKRQHF